MGLILFAWFLVLGQIGFCQPFTALDSLRGAYGPGRDCYDLLHYHLHLKVEPETRFLSGWNKLSTKALSNFRLLQIDLSEEFEIDSIESGQGLVKWKRMGKALKLQFREEIKKGQLMWVKVHYHGHPHVATNPPWEGGFVWQKDKDGFPWIGVACEGEGASLWFPSKDHPADEPDSALLEFEVPKNLVVVSNGQLLGKAFSSDSTAWYRFRVSYPINHYNITFNAGAFHSWEEAMDLQDGKSLKMSFFAPNYEWEAAKKQFSQARKVIQVLGELFGPYPFPNDGYKVVRTPYKGMEHQSCIAHGDPLQDNGFGFDFILMHETGHEWWGNRTSASDHADMWIHESFCTYTEALFVEKIQGRTKAEEYLLSQKKKIKNKSPIQGPKGVYFNQWKDSDMYYKGSWMLHSLRYVIDNDSLWFAWLRSFEEKLGFKPISSGQVVEYANSFFQRPLEAFFAQYLQNTQWPGLEWKQEKGESGWQLFFRRQTIDGFDYPMPLRIDGKREKVLAGKEWTPWPGIISEAKVEPMESLFLYKVKEIRN
jgi:aminopeptidase N